MRKGNLVVLLAFGFVLTASTDFELRIDGIDGRTCAKSAEVCETARTAIRAGMWKPGADQETPTWCQPSPNCFSYESETIKNFNREPRR